MAVTVDQGSLGTGNSSGTGTTTMSTTAAVASGAHIYLAAGRFNFTNSTMSCSGGSLTWTEDKTVVSSNIRTSIFRAYAASGLSSSTTLTVTHTGGGTADCIIGAYSLLGVAQGSPTATNSNSGVLAGWDGGSVTAGSGDVLIGGAFVDTSIVSSSTPTSPAVERIDKNVSGQAETLVIEDKINVSGTDSTAGTWNNAGTWAAVSASYAAAASGALPPFPRRAQRGLVMR